MMRRVFAAIIFLVGLSVPALAYYLQDDRSIAIRNMRGGTVHVTVIYQSPNSCGKFVSQRRGTPGGDPGYGYEVTGIVQMTVTIDESRRGCGRTGVIHELMVLPINVTDHVIEIFYVSMSGKLLSNERVAIRG